MSGADPGERRAGFVGAAVAYVIWGFIPLYLSLVAFADVREILGQRVLWAIPAAFVAVLVTSGWRRGWREIGAALQPSMLATLAVASIFLATNWALYAWLVLEGRVIESSLAYFLAPLVGVAIGVAFFGERLRLTQALALLFALIGVAVQGLALGAPPWIALAICASWSAYAVMRKRAPVSAAAGLLVECLAMAPAAMGLLVWVGGAQGLAFASDWRHAMLLALAGPITAAPLIAFAFAARRVSFTALGLLQFIAPSLQFATGLAFGEPFTPLRGLSFALIWAGLGFFAWDTIARAQKA